MKKLLLFVLTSLFVGGALFAQTNESGKVKNEGNVALHDVTLSDAVSDALKAVLLSGTDGYYFDKTAVITDSTGKESTTTITTSGQNTAVLTQ